ncbi:TetR/AcrR family transcriptional regulator [Ginsengibacter hankyongi]|uniref:TetR/AcrR family transcriptional regulator n=1 Tax=Ginsengibacter hankyongi TaxID=2607284 RepID=A0A5J5ICU3_9BACT|nr:TetR/AcrR family transcriptional regulator [Ginsengibacter hankyongi]KAA9037150.1 TetR/AcrR family transcriptional regulator [Ginsengibacter hankyongi]
MSTAERKTKEKEELRALILKGAKKLFIERGIEQTTIRNIADEINYSVGTVYVYFKDKNSILHELHTLGFKQLGGEMRVLFSVSEPMERLAAIGRVYIRFAVDNPDMYDLMFNMKAPMEYLHRIEKEEWNEGKATFNVLKTTVEECIRQGYFIGHQPEPLSFAIWGGVHGMCSLYIRGRIRAVNLGDPEIVLIAAHEEFVKLLNKQ